MKLSEYNSRLDGNFDEVCTKLKLSIDSLSEVYHKDPEEVDYENVMENYTKLIGLLGMKSLLIGLNNLEKDDIEK